MKTLVISSTISFLLGFTSKVFEISQPTEELLLSLVIWACGLSVLWWQTGKLHEPKQNPKKA